MSLLDQIAKAKEEGVLDDQTEDNGPSYQPPEEGNCIARFVSYIELGEHDQPDYEGKAKPPADEAILEFELLGKKHRREIEVEDENGEKVKKIVYPIHRERITVKKGSRAGFFKLLSAMDYGRGNTHMAFMLGEAFIVNIIHNKSKDGKRTYANIKDKSGVWKIGAPVKVDDEGETVPLKAPAATVEPRLLLWDSPTIEQWQSIYIDGTYTKKEGDKEVEVSRNWIQNLAKSANNFEGSALQTMILAAVDGDLPDVDDEEEELEDKAPEQEEDDDPLADLEL